MMNRAILALDSGGRPNHWTTWEKAVLLQVKGHVSWSLGTEFEIRGGTSRLTGEETIVRVPSIIAVKNQVFVGKVPFNNSTLFARDRMTCCYCAARFPRSELTREHIIPESKGGETSWLNCCACCKSCNGRKGNKMLSASGMELVYLPYVPNSTEALILSGRNIVADQMEFLLNCLPRGSRILLDH
jgi:5-methylcytosine-specific restriction endonuclease McrA